jgi:hypothetical protein
MNHSKLVGALLTIAAAMTTVAFLRWRTAVPAIITQRILFGTVANGANDSLDDALADAEEFTVSNDPFRLANAPSPIRFDAKEDRVAGPAAIAVPRPHLSLKAIVGPPWQAVIDGIPGQPAGTMVKTGAHFDKLVARVVTGDSVIMQGADTTWVLRFGRP